MKVTRPVCRYYGGKWKLADWIIQFFPQHRCYVEPFGGAASVLLKKKPSDVEVYNDLSTEMVNLFRVLRDEDAAAKLRALLALTPYAREEWEAAYEFSNDPIEQARRTIVMASMSFNPSKVGNRLAQGFRTVSSGHHKLPHDFINLGNSLEAVTHRMKRVIIDNRDALTVMRSHDRAATLHYVDPPYLGHKRADARNLYRHELQSEEEHEKLANTLKSLKGYVILSGYPSSLYNRLYADWTPFSRQAVSAAAVKGKSKRTEVVWLNPRAAAAQRQTRLWI